MILWFFDSLESMFSISNTGVLVGGVSNTGVLVGGVFRTLPNI